jgi:hypothetical protein
MGDPDAEFEAADRGIALDRVQGAEQCRHGIPVAGFAAQVGDLAFQRRYLVVQGVTKLQQQLAVGNVAVASDGGTHGPSQGAMGKKYGRRGSMASDDAINPDTATSPDQGKRRHCCYPDPDSHTFALIG